MVRHTASQDHAQTRKAPSAPAPAISLERHDDRILVLIRRGPAAQQRAFMLSFPGEARQLADLLAGELAKGGSQ